MLNETMLSLRRVKRQHQLLQLLKMHQNNCSDLMKFLYDLHFSDVLIQSPLNCLYKVMKL